MIIFDRMNREIVEELILKAIDYADATYKPHPSEGFRIQEWDIIRLTRLVELAVTECIDVIDETHGSKKLMRPDPYQRIVSNIQEHFGSEE